MNVIFSGNVSDQATAGQQVTITVTAPDGTKSTVTATTKADKTYASPIESYAIAGNYSYTASIPADSEYVAASTTGTFTVTLANRVLTITVTPQ